jgi:hypothetical protein
MNFNLKVYPLTNHCFIYVSRLFGSSPQSPTAHLQCLLCVFLEDPAFQNHTLRCSNTPREDNYIKRTCKDVNQKLREATKDQLACRFWKSVYLKFALELERRPIVGKLNFSFKSPPVI